VAGSGDVDARDLDDLGMRAALADARRHPAAPFGAAIVDVASGAIVARGANRSRHDAVLHGEIVALRDAAVREVARPWSGLALYTTAEPCPMCAAAAVWAGVGLVVFGVDIPWLHAAGWEQIDLRAAEVFARSGKRAPRLRGGVHVDACRALFEAARS
jgi:tRNA(Arg) A34 adenosine deaminase TadA